MVIFQSKFNRFKTRLKRNQKQTPNWKVTRWSIHDYDKFRDLIVSIKDLLNGLESITSALGLLRQQQAALIEEIESLSDTRSLRLLQTVASRSTASSALRAISDTASHRVSMIESSMGGTSFHTAPTHPFAASSVISCAAYRPIGYDAEDIEIRAAPAENAHQETTPLSQKPTQTSTIEVPQHQRWMASLAHRRDTRSREHSFMTEDLSYGSRLNTIKGEGNTAWRSYSMKLIDQANKESSLAQQAFVELRTIRQANISFISVSPVHDRLDCLLASIEGPPGTPYEGGLFWITVKLVLHKLPVLRFQTRIYHPNIDCTGKLCASYKEWWTDENLRTYMGTLTQTDAPWFSQNRSNTFSLGAVLVAVCGLLASPNVEDPLVPEIAETYITDYNAYFRAAQLYAMKYALNRTIPGSLVFADEDNTAEI